MYLFGKKNGEILIFFSCLDFHNSHPFSIEIKLEVKPLFLSQKHVPATWKISFAVNWVQNNIYALTSEPCPCVIPKFIYDGRVVIPVVLLKVFWYHRGMTQIVTFGTPYFPQFFLFSFLLSQNMYFSFCGSLVVVERGNSRITLPSQGDFGL